MKNPKSYTQTRTFRHIARRFEQRVDAGRATGEQLHDQVVVRDIERYPEDALVHVEVLLGDDETLGEHLPCTRMWSYQ